MADPDSMCFFSSFIAGVGRCMSVRLLTEFKDRWKGHIETHSLREAMIEAYRVRYAELRAEEARIEAERVEREKYDPKGKR